MIFETIGLIVLFLIGGLGYEHQSHQARQLQGSPSIQRDLGAQHLDGKNRESISDRGTED